MSSHIQGLGLSRHVSARVGLQNRGKRQNKLPDEYKCIESQQLKTGRLQRVKYVSPSEESCSS